MCESSVDSAFRNFLRAGVLKKRSRTVIEVPGRQAGFFHLEDLAAVDFDDRAGGFVGRAGLQAQAGDRGDRGQSFSAETQRGDAQQVFGILDFRGGVALEGQQGVVAHHAAAVVGDLDELLAAGFDLDPDAGGAGVERVLEQFLDHRSRALHHFAGGDLVGNGFGENVDAAHGISRRSSARSSARTMAECCCADSVVSLADATALVKRVR